MISFNIYLIVGFFLFKSKAFHFCSPRSVNIPVDFKISEVLRLIDPDFWSINSFCYAYRFRFVIRTVYDSFMKANGKSTLVIHFSRFDQEIIQFLFKVFSKTEAIAKISNFFRNVPKTNKWDIFMGPTYRQESKHFSPIKIINICRIFVTVMNVYFVRVVSNGSGWKWTYGGTVYSCILAVGW